MEFPDETPVWTGTPSQWLNVGTFALCGALVLAFGLSAWLWSEPLIALGILAPVAFAFWRWLAIRCTEITVTSQRISTRVGILSRVRSDLELYRVKDTTLEEPLLLRMVSLANIHLESSDKTSSSMVLPAIRDAEALRQQIRAHVEKMRVLRRVRELDFDA